MSVSKLSRRDWLKGIGAGAISLGAAGALRVTPTMAQAAPTGQSVSAFARFKVGEFELTVIQDLPGALDPNIFGVNAGEGEIAALLQANNIPVGETISGSFNVTLLNTGDSLALLDTGLSAQNGGKLMATLDLLGVKPEDIDSVVLSHFHPDHVNGVSDGSAVSFPNAMYYFPQPEWDFLQGVEGNDTVTNATTRMQPVMAADQLQFYAAEAEIIPGVQAVAAYGHSPGHMALLVASGGSQLLNIVDAAIQPVLSLQRPDWFAAFDADGPMASESRKALLGRAADEQIQVFGYHFAFPGVGYVMRDGDGFRFNPLI